MKKQTKIMSQMTINELRILKVDKQGKLLTKINKNRKMINALNNIHLILLKQKNGDQH